MAIGERIHFIRNLRNMTQKELGKAVGFSENTADVRMAQYETGSRTPKEALVKSLSDVLDVSPLALNVPDIDSYLGLIHTLFAMEDVYGIEAEQHGSKVHIVFDSSEQKTSFALFSMLSEWATKTEMLRNGEISKDEYDQWRYNYPSDEVIRN